MRAWRRYLEEQKGHVIVLVALSLTFLLGMSALVTDAGLLYFHKSRLQNAVDAAALAAARELPASSPERRDRAEDRAREYALANGVSEPLDLSFPVEREIRVDMAGNGREVGLLYARLLGQERAFVKARAAARVAPVTGAEKGIDPLGVLRTDIKEGEVLLKLDSSGVRQGWFGPLRVTPGASGAGDYEKSLKDGGGPVWLAQVIREETGNMVGPTIDGLAARFTNCTHCTLQKWKDAGQPGTCRRVMIIPVLANEATITDAERAQLGLIGATLPPPENKYHWVVGFAAFFVEHYELKSNNCEIRGQFLHYVYLPGGNISSTAPDYGVYGLKLME